MIFRLLVENHSPSPCYIKNIFEWTVLIINGHEFCLLLKNPITTFK